MSDIAIDASAIVEIWIDGPGAATARQTLESATTTFATSITRVEAAFVMMGRIGWDRATFDRNWNALGVEEVAVDSSIGSLAISAFDLWGKGRSKAALNFGDCFSYALATSRGLPLLFVGKYFAATDVERA